SFALLTRDLETRRRKADEIFLKADAGAWGSAGERTLLSDANDWQAGRAGWQRHARVGTRAGLSAEGRVRQSACRAVRHSRTQGMRPESCPCCSSGLETFLRPRKPGR